MTDGDITAITEVNPNQFFERRLSWPNATRHKKSLNG
jgi:hypothetical protein